MTQHTSDKSSSWGDFPVGDSTMTSLVSTMNYCAQNKVSCLSFRGSLSYSQACIKDMNKWCLKEWISLKKCKLFFGTPWEMSHNTFTIAFTSTLLQVPIQVGHKMPMKSPYSLYSVNTLVPVHKIVVHWKAKRCSLLKSIRAFLIRLSSAKIGGDSMPEYFGHWLLKQRLNESWFLRLKWEVTHNCL